MRYTYNEYGQLAEHPDYYVDEPDYLEMAGGNELLADCLSAYDEHCAPFMGSGFDPCYSDLPDFDHFKDEWFTDYAAKEAEALAMATGFDPNGDYCTALTLNYAKYLQDPGREPIAAVKDYQRYFNGWYRHGLYNEYGHNFIQGARHA